MIRSIRMRPIDKPLIIQQIIYNHCEEVEDSNSELSFLKLTEKASKEIISSSHDDPFNALEKQIYKVQQQSALHLSEVKRQLNTLLAVKKGASVDMRKDVLEENKQNLNVIFQRVVHSQDQLVEGKFEMDQNFNYVKNKEIVESEPVSRIHVTRNQLYSLGNSRKLEDRQPQILTLRKNRIRSKSVSYQTDKQPTARKIPSRQNQRSSSSGKHPKKGRIYEQILSLYTIPKLLAMESKGS